MSKGRELLFSVTSKDCEWDYVRGSGAGGQKRNKTSSAVRCRHKPSGAIGYAEDTRSQSKNKQLAFKRMAESDEFKRWNKIEASRKSGELTEMRERIEKETSNPKLTKVEGKDYKGRWVDIEQSEAYTEEQNATS